jgi:hypothetical protein
MRRKGELLERWNRKRKGEARKSKKSIVHMCGI